MTSILLKKPSTLPSRRYYTHFWIDPAGYCFCVRKKMNLLSFIFFKKSPKSSFSFAAHLKFLKRKVILLVHSSCVKVLHCIVEYFVSHPFKFRLNEKMLTWTELLFKVRITNFVEDIVRFHVCCPKIKAKLSVFMLTSGLICWQLLLT